jgi:hypothetical protein
MPQTLLLEKRKSQRVTAPETKRQQEILKAVEASNRKICKRKGNRPTTVGFR